MHARRYATRYRVYLAKCQEPLPILNRWFYTDIEWWTYLIQYTPWFITSAKVFNRWPSYCTVLGRRSKLTQRWGARCGIGSPLITQHSGGWMSNFKQQIRASVCHSTWLLSRGKLWATTDFIMTRCVKFFSLILRPFQLTWGGLGTN